MRCVFFFFFAALFVLTLPASAQQKAEVAITFDDLPAHGDLPPGVTRTDVTKKILNALHAEKVPAVYGFVNGERIKDDADRKEVLKMWIDGGYPLASHTFSHPNLTDISAEEFEANIEKNEPVLKEFAGNADWHWFRYPFLHEGETLEKRDAVRVFLQKKNCRIAQVTLDFEDYAWNNPYARCTAKHDEKAIAWLKESYLKTAEEYIRLGREMAQQIYGRDIKHVLLLHVGAFDAEMLPDLLLLLKKDGFQFVSLPEAQSDPAYQTNPNFGLKYGGTLLEQIFDGRKLKYPTHGEKPLKELDLICR